MFSMSELRRHLVGLCETTNLKIVTKSLSEMIFPHSADRIKNIIRDVVDQQQSTLEMTYPQSQAMKNAIQNLKNRQSTLSVCMPNEYAMLSDNRVYAMGAYSKIYQLIQNNDGGCKDIKDVKDTKDTDRVWILKVNDTLNLAERSTAFREVFFFRLLNEFRKKEQDKHMFPLVPRVERLCWHQSTDLCAIVMESFTMDVLQLSVKTALELRTAKANLDCPPFVCVLKERHLTQLVRIILRLDALGIVHGDLRLDQFLYCRESDRIVLTDFGFAGFSTPTGHATGALRDCILEHKTIPDISLFPDLGWPCNPYGVALAPRDTKRTRLINGVLTSIIVPDESAQPMDSKHPLSTHGLVPWLNLWELLVYCWNVEMHVWLDDTAHPSEPNLLNVRPFGGFDESLLPKHAQMAFETLCKKPEDLIRKRGMMVNKDSCFVLKRPKE